MAATARTRTKGATVGALKRVWMPRLILAAVALATLCGDRLHEASGKTQTTRPVGGLANDTKTFDPETCR